MTARRFFWFTAKAVVAVLALIGLVTAVWWVALAAYRYMAGEQCVWIFGIGGCA